ncbi:hypothetical protein Mgra_00007327 [Meloidogyne graminicola]|uniref:N-acetyltransferase ESCO acetyl-transferase domain-containing protein n=1 Tax=Meloidogyne graminicola TaxID=189291 RepID=A0A8S9ZIY1_9BILA|nr:hypothetical protein Mgra_00007327 [Meloidogyne graminicola]
MLLQRDWNGTLCLSVEWFTVLKRLLMLNNMNAFITGLLKLLILEFHKHKLSNGKAVFFNENVEAPISGTLFDFLQLLLLHLNEKIETIIVSKIRIFVNVEIGYAADLPVWNAHGKRKMLVFISDAKPPFIGGLLLIDPIKEVTLMPEQKNFKSSKIGSFLGIDRIWVHSHLRRKGLATFLLDSARRLLIPKDGKILPKSRVAFGDQTIYVLN